MPSNKQRLVLGTRRLKSSDSTYGSTSAGEWGHHARVRASSSDAVNNHGS